MFCCSVNGSGTCSGKEFREEFPNYHAKFPCMTYAGKLMLCLLYVKYIHVYHDNKPFTSLPFNKRCLRDFKAEVVDLAGACLFANIRRKVSISWPSTTFPRSMCFELNQPTVLSR